MCERKKQSFVDYFLHLKNSPARSEYTVVRPDHVCKICTTQYISIMSNAIPGHLEVYRPLNRALCLPHYAWALGPPPPNAWALGPPPKMPGPGCLSVWIFDSPPRC